jgi:hypothetical protein
VSESRVQSNGEAMNGARNTTAARTRQSRRSYHRLGGLRRASRLINPTLVLPAGAIPMETVTAEPITWLWHGRIPFGKLSTIDGDPGQGKGVLLCDLMARVTTGRPMPFDKNARTLHPANVILLGAEDALRDTIKPRLLAAKADEKFILTYDFAHLPKLPDGIDQLIEGIDYQERKTGVPVKLIVIDPLSAMLGPTIRMTNDQSFRRAALPLTTLAEDRNIAITSIRHLTKNERAPPSTEPRAASASALHNAQFWRSVPLPMTRRHKSSRSSS